MTEKIKLGVSSCLLGHKVRWNGDHQLDHFIAEELGRYVEYVHVCPEVETGLGTPRETLRLMGDSDSPRLVFSKSGGDITERMKTWAEKRLDELATFELRGYIFKSRSPSSGMERIRVYGDNGEVRRNGVGIFARAFMNRFPLLPVEDEGRLNDAGLRENFIVRVFTYDRWRRFMTENAAISGLVQFHTNNKLLFMAHHPPTARELGRLTAQAGQIPDGELLTRYESLMMAGLKFKATAKKNTAVLQHMMGFFKKELTAAEKKELLDIIWNYYNELIPLIVPVTLIGHYVRKYNQDYLAKQYYLNPHPLELKLRNHA